MASKVTNEERIKLGSALIAFMQEPGMTRGRLEEVSWQFIGQNSLEPLIVTTWQHSLEQNIPGLCDYRAINYQLIWQSDKFRKFYQVPLPLLDLYRTNVIHNGLWCDNLARVHPELYSAGIINQITAAKGDAVQIRAIVNPLKAQSQ
ncbi:MAG: hypothetical protein H0X24_02425 [Ktedonobacterales bacterium]|nr:hypothetical protein [Ktedonobacterales bacterium]